MEARKQLRQFLKNPRGVVVPGAFDAISAAMIERAGFEAISITGAGVSCSAGFPDVGLLTMTEVVERSRAIVRGTRLPVIADADTGYGNVVNVRRTVQEFERAGLAGIHIEDQVSPKKCGLLEGIEVIPTDEMVGKIRAAIDSRQDPDFVIIARTDARASEDFDSVIQRANAYAAAGADALFLFDLQSRQELEQAAQQIRAPLVTHVSRGGSAGLLHPDELKAMGYAMIDFPLTVLQAACKTMEDVLAHLAQTGTIEPLFNRMWTSAQLYDLVGLSDVEAFEAAHSPE